MVDRASKIMVVYLVNESEDQAPETPCTSFRTDGSRRKTNQAAAFSFSEPSGLSSSVMIVDDAVLARGATEAEA